MVNRAGIIGAIQDETSYKKGGIKSTFLLQNLQQANHKGMLHFNCKRCLSDMGNGRNTDTNKESSNRKNSNNV